MSEQRVHGEGHLQGYTLMITPDGEDFWKPACAPDGNYLKRGFTYAIPRHMREFPIAVEANDPPLIDGEWEGGPCFIIGGGPSLRDFDWKRLKGKKTIAINRAFEFFDPSVIFSLDGRFYEWLSNLEFGLDAFNRYNALKTVRCIINTDNTVYPPNVWRIPAFPNPGGWSPKLVYGLPASDNSGVGALNMAVLLGANPVYLLGFDMSGHYHGEQVHFHDGYPVKNRARQYAKFRASFNMVAGRAKSQTRIVNLNPKSKLECFEFGDIDEVL